MCLTTIIATHDQPSDLIVDGWKEFGGTASQPKSLHFAYRIKLDQWIAAVETSPPKDIPVSNGKTYRAGFHAYADVDDRGRPPSATRRVYLRKITCTGEQNGKKCVVAQEMYVPSDPTAWPPTAAKKKPIRKL